MGEIRNWNGRRQNSGTGRYTSDNKGTNSENERYPSGYNRKDITQGRYSADYNRQEYGAGRPASNYNSRQSSEFEDYLANYRKHAAQSGRDASGAGRTYGTGRAYDASGSTHEGAPRGTSGRRGYSQSEENRVYRMDRRFPKIDNGFREENDQYDRYRKAEYEYDTEETEYSSVQLFFKGVVKAWKRMVKRTAHKLERMNRYQKMMILLCVAALLAGGILGRTLGVRSVSKTLKQEADAQVKNAEAKTAKVQKELDELKEAANVDGQTNADRPWNLQLVNEEYPMEEGYVPELAEVATGYSVDSRIADATTEMLEAAKEAGLYMHIVSAYRSVETQETVFNETVGTHLANGMSYLDAVEETKLSVAVPGTSEHGMGLALDIVADAYGELDEKQADTPEAKWLEENCHKYGFILRYPPDKTDETGIIYEPWHYRYVGVEDATKIMEEDVTLETYLREHEVKK